MGSSIQNIITGIIISAMSFLGWQENNLKKEIQEDISHIKKSYETLIQNNKFSATTTIVQKEKEYYLHIVENKKSYAKKQVSSPALETKKENIKISPPKNEPEEKPETKNFFSILNPEKDSVENRIKKSVANIYCIRRVPQGIEKIVGSAVAIDPKGLFLTNAHVAVYIALEESTYSKDVSCFLRTGSPAKKAYDIQIVYFPKKWAEANKNFFSISSPTGSGEKDYALVRISEALTSDSSLLQFSYLNISPNSLQKNDTGYLAGYPANFFDSSLLDSALYEATQKISIIDAINFGEIIGAVFTSPTSLAYKGSSGGALTTESGELAGIIFATGEDYLGQKNIQAITLPYIKKDILDDSGKNLNWYIKNNKTEAENFATNEANIITKIMTEKSF